MFPKKNRFSFKKGLPRQVLNSPSFTLRFQENNEEGLKIAVVASKKVDKRATVRNKIKRKFLDIIKDTIEKTFPFSLVFFIKRGALENQELKEEIGKALNKL